ncbi:MAG: hypothetical protein ACR2QK_17320 [Acidimicrobiales bacterium]
MAERRTSRTSVSRLRPLFPLAAIWFLGCLLLVGLVVQNQVPYDELLLDPNSLNRAPWYTGLVSNLGILGWTTATAAGYFGSWIARYGNRPAASTMLGRGAVLSTVLLLDDLFQLHVAVEPLFGISKPVVYLCYLIVAGWWVATQWREIGRTRSELLLASVGAFGASIVIDQLGATVPGLDQQTSLLLEDACKFLGVLAWAQYFALTASDIVKSIVNELRRAPGPADGEGRNGFEDYAVSVGTAGHYSTRNRAR